MLTLKLVLKFSQEFFKLECCNLVYTWKMSCCIMGLRVELFAIILLFICPFFIQFSLFCVIRLLRILVTVFFATYLLLLTYSSALLKQCSGAIVRFSDSSSFILFYYYLFSFLISFYSA